MTIHDDEPIVDHSQLKEGDARYGQTLEVVQVIVAGVVSRSVVLLHGGIFAAIHQVHVPKTFHANDGKKVVGQHQHDEGRYQSGHKDHCRTKDITKSTFHSKQGQ